MQHCVNIFIGKGFDALFEGVGEIVANQHKDAIKYNAFYKVSDAKSNTLEFETLKLMEVLEKEPTPGVNLIVPAEKQTVKIDDLTDYWSDSIFDKVLTVGTSGHDTLYVFIHLQLYRKETYGVAKTLCHAIKQSGRPAVINFVGYCEDLAKFIEPAGTQFASFDAKASIKDIYTELNFTPQYNKFVLLQNRSLKGVSIFNDEDSSMPFYDMVANLTVLLSSHYDKVFSSSDFSPRDVVGLGFSSICFDKYIFASYLLQKTMLKAIDNQCINNNDVDVNRANDSAAEILKTKDHILTAFLERWNGKEKEGPNYDEIKNEIDDILAKAMEKFQSDRDVTAKTTVLAALLSKTECELFSSSFYNPDSITFDDLYSEAIDYYIKEDEINYYKIDGEKPINPINELKTVNRKLIQAEVMVRTLREQMESYEDQIEKNDKVTECFIDDGYFKFGDHKFKMLPSVDEVPLEETYQAHAVNVDSADLRANFSPIKNQGQQGSCLSFTLTSVFEYVMRVNNQEECDLSEAFLYYNARLEDEHGNVNEDHGSKFVPSLESLRKYGIALEKAWPYNDSVYDLAPSQDAYDDAAGRKLVKAMNVERSVDAIKSAVSDGYPVACSFTLFESFSTSDGYVPMPTDDDIASLENAGEDKSTWRHSRHAMVIVGYSDKLQRFLVRNSWGDDWGDKGYCYIPYSYIAHPKLLNFACIITEVASLKSVLPELKKIPALEINNADVKIRYYVAAAAYGLQKKVAQDLEQRRLELLDYFEREKYMFSEPNARDEFIEESVKAIENENAEHKMRIKTMTEEQEKIFEDFKAARKRILIKSSIVAASILLLFILWNSLVGEALKISILWLGVSWVAVGAVAYLVFHSHYNNWREERDALDSKIKILKDKITKNARRIVVFRHKTYAAWKTITSLGSVHLKLEQLYSKMVNLVNNLRAWYIETRDSASEDRFSSPYPNISVVNRERLDSFFEQCVADSVVCDVDLCQNIEEYQTTAEYLATYKKNLRETLKNRLFEKLQQVSFNMSDHVVSGKYSNVATDIDSELLTDWERMAGIMVHVQSNERGVITTDNLVFAPNLGATENDLRRKLANLHVSSYEQTDDNFKISLVRVATLSFDECVAFQPKKQKK